MRAPEGGDVRDGPTESPTAGHPHGDGAPRLPSLTPGDALALAAWFGLVGGFLDLAATVYRRHVMVEYSFYLLGSFFPWAFPTVNLAFLLAAGLPVALLNKLRPGLVTLRVAAWLFATLGLWEPLLRLSLTGEAALILTAGLGRWISLGIASRGPSALRVMRPSLAGLLVLLGVTAALTTGRQALTEALAVARLPEAPPGAGNVVLLVMDSVRADNLGLLGYGRDTTPNLGRWARKGVTFARATAPAPWTFPSHASFFTGEWPYRLDAQFRQIYRGRHPTLAGFLAAKGYQTAGFVANTNFCSYETGLDRGFLHYDDYPLSLRGLLGTSVAGRWLIARVLDPRDAYGLKWVRFQSRDAAGINGAFLDWLSRRRTDRPFFAFLNYMDAHEPFVLPVGHREHFGLEPQTPAESEFLINYWNLDKLRFGPRDVALARDAYDDCIALLDRRIGALLEELERRGVLRDTTVIVTSDHGEEFGEHGLFNHGSSLYAFAARVPLIILGPGSAPSRRVVEDPASLRDLPATVVDLLGLRSGAPFPGRSLATLWGPGAAADGPTGSPALSEVVIPPLPHPRDGVGIDLKGYAMSLIDGDLHYLRDSFHVEELYNLADDPTEQVNLAATPAGREALGRFREALLRALHDSPPQGGRSGAVVRPFLSALEAQGRDRPTTPASARAGPPGPSRPGL